MVEPKTELVRNQIANVRRKELSEYQRELDMKWMNNRMEDGRMSSLLAMVQREADMEKEYQERTDHAAFVNAKAHKEIELGFQVAKNQREETRAYQRRIWLRENEQDLKTLARKLQAGYVCRDLQLQIQNNKYKKLQEKEEDRRSGAMIAKCIHSDQEATELEAKSKRERQLQYGDELRQQLVFRQYQKQCQYEDSLIEKKMLDDIMRTISDEDQRELQLKHDLTETTKKEMKMFQAAKRAWNEKHRVVVINEETEIERQQQALSDRSAAITAERKRKEAEKERISAMIAEKIMAEEEKTKRRGDIIQLLQEQEALEKNHQEAIDKAMKLEAMKRGTKESLLEQMENKKRLLQEEKDREKQYLMQVKEKQRMEEEKEREKNALKRERNKKHVGLLLKQAEVDQMVKNNRRAQEEERNRAVKAYEDAFIKESLEERKTIIKEHVPRLLGFLQAGVVRKEDMPEVKEGAKVIPELANVDLDQLVSSQKRKIFPKCNTQCMKIREY